MAAFSVAAVVLAVFTALLGLGIVAGVLWLLWRALRGVGWLLARALGFVRREAVDAVHAAGALVTALATLPLLGVNLAIFRTGAVRHYGRAFVDELKGVGVGLWRVALGNPLRFVGLGGFVDVVEARLPDIVDRAPRPRRARRAVFDGYQVVGTLPSGGSGAQLFIARPTGATQRRFERASRYLPAEVVIKSFALETGSTLPQIVRESRALEAASRLGLVCEHQLTDDHFYYVMPYVKGEDLERVTRALHARGTPDGLAEAELRLALGYAMDLLDSLQRFHSGGLWHKDVKPSNVIVAKGRAHLVDLGLVTPLASALTLTTHGTEYYRDPEMVRLAMQGVKVHEVDGVRFDVYSAGAVLFSLLENSFPAHGSLSCLSKRVPDAVRWIVQRAMAEMNSRYASAAEMRADLAVLVEAPDPYVLRPADLPSFRREGRPQPDFTAAERPGFRPEPSPAFAPPLSPEPFLPARRRRRARPALILATAGACGLLSMASSAFFAGHVRDSHRAGVAAASPRTRSVARERTWPSLSEKERRVVERAREVLEDFDTTPEAPGAGAGQEPASDPRPSSKPRSEVVEPEVLEHAGTRGVSATGTERSKKGLPGEGVLPARGRILVIDDVTTAVDSRVLSLLRTRLAEDGFSVVGLETEEEGVLEAVELVASARHAAGLGRADEPETQALMQQFLDGEPGLDALILVSRSEPESDHLYRVFVRSRGAEGGH